MSTTRYTKGVSTAPNQSPLKNFVEPDPTKIVKWWDDFHDYDQNAWVLSTTETGGGSASEEVQNEVGGVFKITNDDADDDADFLQWAGVSANNGTETFKITTTERSWFKARFKVSDATQSDFVIGLQVVDISPLDVSDGIFFQKDDGDADLDFHVEKDNTSSDATAITSLSDDTYVTVGWYYDKKEFHLFVNDQPAGSVSDDNLPNDEELTISFGIQNGEAASKSLSVDYILVAQDRP